MSTSARNSRPSWSPATAVGAMDRSRVGRVSFHSHGAPPIFQSVTCTRDPFGAATGAVIHTGGASGLASTVRAEHTSTRSSASPSVVCASASAAMMPRNRVPLPRRLAMTAGCTCTRRAAACGGSDRWSPVTEGETKTCVA
eukprot:scaffold61129_cov70-Phaeocystis_antarctica.AAC.7